MLDYSVPPFQFLIGGFDASQYLDSISLSVPMHEPGQALLWEGQFKVSNNLAAKIFGLTDVDFSEFGSPSRWRPYQQVVRLNIKGYPSPVFRIENYRYNPQSRTGEGRLTQIPSAVAGERMGDILPITVGGTIGLCIDKLLAAAFVGASVNPGRSIAGDGGVLDVPLSTRNPWADALRLVALNWRWLTVNVAETIVSVDGGGGIVFSRNADRVELVPDLAAIFQSAQKVIVTGARQVTDTSAAAENPVPQAPRPKFKTTTEMRPAGTVFPSLGSDTTPTLLEEKTIIYQYWDDDTWTDYLPFGVFLTPFLVDIQSPTQSGINIYGQPPPDLNVPLQTITIKRQPKGYLFSSLGVVTTLAEAEVVVESNIRKLTLKPAGVLFSSLAPSTTLEIEKREELTSQYIPPGAELVPVATNNNGQAQAYEARPVLEAAQPVPTRPLKTETLKGEANLQPLNWTPVFNRPLIVDFGFLPDQARAAYLAQKIAVREQQRREQVLVDMPIPDEWLAAGWPVLAKSMVGGNVYLMDGCAIEIADGVAKFGFTGGLVSQGVSVSIGGVPTIVQRPQYQILIDLMSQLVFEAEIAAAPLFEVEGNLIFEVEFTLE